MSPRTPKWGAQRGGSAAIGGTLNSLERGSGDSPEHHRGGTIPRNCWEAFSGLNVGVWEVWMDPRCPGTSREGLGQEEPLTQHTHPLFFPKPGFPIPKARPDGGGGCEEEEDGPGAPGR